MNIRFLIYTFCCVLLALAPQRLLAQTDVEPITVYPASYFTQFNPRTALDMVDRVPGFSVESSDEDRGLGQASGNILINGNRSFGKSYDAEEALNGVLSSSVGAIELYEGASLGIPGLSGIVANVIVATDSFEGGWQWNQSHRSNFDSVWAELYLNASGKLDNLNWTVAVANEPIRRGDFGNERVFIADQLVETRDEITRRSNDLFDISGSLRWEGDNGHSANLGFSAGTEYQLEQEESIQLPVNGTQVLRLLEEKSSGWAGEISADYELPMGPGTLKTVLYQSLEAEPAITVVDEFDENGDILSTERSDEDERLSETVLRTEYSLEQASAVWNFSLEAALNTMDNDSAQFESVNNAPLLLDEQETCGVEERRAEANVTYGRQFSSQLGFQASLGGEFSEIEQSGNFSGTRDFTRPKGFLALSYQAFESSNFSLRLERQVGQLNFNDFCTNVQLDDGSVVAGNPDLVPEQTWRSELQWEQRLGTSAFTLSLWHDNIDDLVDRIPIGNSDAVGNIDSASRVGLDLSTTVRLEPFGWEGARLTVEYSLQKGDVVDPVTGESRRFSDERIRAIDTELRHDIVGSQWAWGVEFRRELEGPQYRLNQLRRERREEGFWHFYLENKDFFGLRARFIVRNITQVDTEFSRFVFDSRRGEDLVRSEIRNRTINRIWQLDLSGSF